MHNQLELPDHVSPLCKNLLKQLLDKNPLRRLGSKTGADEIKAHPYFEDVNWDDVFNKRI